MADKKLRLQCSAVDTQTTTTMALISILKKTKHEGRVGEVGQAMADGNKNNRTLKHHVT